MLACAGYDAYTLRRYNTELRSFLLACSLREPKLMENGKWFYCSAYTSELAPKGGK